MSTENVNDITYRSINLDTSGRSLVEVARLLQGLADVNQTALSVEHEGIDLRVKPGQRWENAVRDWHQASIDLATDRLAEAERDISSWNQQQNPGTQFTLEYPAGTHGVFTYVPHEGAWQWEVEISDKAGSEWLFYFGTMQEAVYDFMKGFVTDPPKATEPDEALTPTGMVGDPCSNCKTPYDRCTAGLLYPKPGREGKACCTACSYSGTHQERLADADA